MTTSKNKAVEFLINEVVRGKQPEKALQELINSLNVNQEQVDDVNQSAEGSVRHVRAQALLRYPRS